MKQSRLYAKMMFLVLSFGGVGWINTAWSAPITFNTALPVAEGEFVGRVQYVVNQSGDDPGSTDRDRTGGAHPRIGWTSLPGMQAAR